MRAEAACPQRPALGAAAPVAKPAAKEFLSCVQAKGIGGGCKLPTNKTKS